jgi:hypothetical protein
MLKPPAPTMPGMTDTLDFVKNLWGSMNIPGTGMPGMPGMSGLGPTLSTDDLDKRIADLKAVESWLNMNLSMLRGTIQAMEVQRGTLAALKSMGASMAEAMRQSGAGADKMGAMPFMPFFNPAPGTPASATDSATSNAAAPAPAPASAGSTAQPGAAAPTAADSGAAASAAMGMPAAVAWWNLLQDQFRQAVTSAMSSTAPAAPGAQTPASTPSKPDAPDAKAAKSASPAPAPGPQADGPAGGGKGRTPRSRADKA